MKFNGYLKLRIGEAVDLKPTTFSLRHSVIFNKAPPALDPYIVVKVDDCKIGQTNIKQKTNTPTYNEEFCLNVMNGKQIEIAVFHDTPIGYDDFVANCVVQFDDLIKTSNTVEPFEGWVSATWALCGIFAAGPSGMWDPTVTGVVASLIYINVPAGRFIGLPHKQVCISASMQLKINYCIQKMDFLVL